MGNRQRATWPGVRQSELARIHFPSGVQSVSDCRPGTGDVSTCSSLPPTGRNARVRSICGSPSVCPWPAGRERRYSKREPSCDQMGLTRRKSSAATSKVSVRSSSDLIHSSSLFARCLRKISFRPSCDSPGCSASMPAFVMGSPFPVTRPLTESNGNDHRRLFSLRMVNASFRPSEDTAISVSMPALVVKRSGPFSPSQCLLRPP